MLTDVTQTNRVASAPVQITTANLTDALRSGDQRQHDAGRRRASAARKRPFMTRRGGRGVRVVGRVAGVGAGAPVLLLAREQRTGARGGPVAQATTAADGSFALLVPRGPSRTLRAAYRMAPDNPVVACSRALHLRVPASVTLHVRPSTVRAGHSIRIFGRLRGGHVPRRGKLVALQAFERGRWQTFTTVRTNRRGSFSKRRGFSFTARGRHVPPARAGAPGRELPVRARLLAHRARPRTLKHQSINCRDAMMHSVRTTITLDPDTELLVKRAMRERGISFKEAVNDAIRAGLAPRPQRSRRSTFRRTAWASRWST